LQTGGLMTDITTKFEVSETNQKLLIGEKWNFNFQQFTLIWTRTIGKI
jgi:hypothetical protein